MARNQRRRAQEALFSPAQSTTPPDEEKAAERTETTEKPIPGFIADKIFGPGFYDQKPDEKQADPAETDVQPVAPTPSPADYIARTYGIEPNCTNVPRLLYAILCEVVRRRK
jgi:hypothetical protein